MALKHPNILRSERRALARGGKLALAAALTLAAAPLVALSIAQPAQALGNGLALTPQMGFNDWNAYGCNVSESLIKSTALAMHTNGMQAAGYQYVNIDDCWMTKATATPAATWSAGLRPSSPTGSPAPPATCTPSA